MKIIDSRKNESKKSAIGNYQEVRKQINEDIVAKSQQSINKSITSGTKISVSKPLNDQKINHSKDYKE